MSEWISVQERIPEKGKAVLLYQNWPKYTAFNCLAKPINDRCFIIVGALVWNDKFVSYNDQWNESGLEHISHWMPIPERPQSSWWHPGAPRLPA